jgi:tryptophan synthase alpha chain
MATADAPSLQAHLLEGRTSGRTVLAPFLTVGDPDADFTVDALERIDRAGAGLCELGIPYSDPIADGPVIQSSYTRALAAGTTVETVFDVARRARERIAMPLVAMTSYSIIFRRGLRPFVEATKASGLSGLVVPDLPLEESEPLDAACRAAAIALVRLVTPTTPRDRAERIARMSTGFLYCVSVAGVTGERTALPDSLAERVRWLKSVTDVPVLVGFGLSAPEQVRAVASVADGAIVGSAVVRHLERAGTTPRGQVLDGIESFVRELATA